MEASGIIQNSAYISTELHVVIFENYINLKCVVDIVAMREGAVPALRLFPVAGSFHQCSILIHLAPNPHNLVN
jgi:hypothetical protein